MIAVNDSVNGFIDVDLAADGNCHWLGTAIEMNDTATREGTNQRGFVAANSGPFAHDLGGSRGHQLDGGRANGGGTTRDGLGVRRGSGQKSHDSSESNDGKSHCSDSGE